MQLKNTKKILAEQNHQKKLITTGREVLLEDDVAKHYLTMESFLKTA